MGKINPGKPVGGTQYGTTLTNSTTHAPTLGTSEKGGAKASKSVKSGPKGEFVPSGKGIMYGSGGNGPSVKNPPVKGKR